MNELLKLEKSINLVKDLFQTKLQNELELVKISSPLVVVDGTGVNDDLNGTERAVKFPIKSLKDKNGVVVHSLAKWKRLRLKELGIESGKGILTDMKALRPDEDYSPIHSIYVDQWDWEVVMESNSRNINYLNNTVAKIYKALVETEKELSIFYPALKPVLPNDLVFIYTEELLQLYPDLTPKERENAIAKKHGAVFLIGIGGKLSDGTIHDGRAPDYDDWSTLNEAGYYGLNGDLIVWNPQLECAFELSSMGIRVDKEALLRQLLETNNEERMQLYFHKLLLSNELPQSIGGGIGQSRVCMFLLKKQHIGEVQVGIWSDEVRNSLQEKGLFLL